MSIVYVPYNIEFISQLRLNIVKQKFKAIFSIKLHYQLDPFKFLSLYKSLDPTIDFASYIYHAFVEKKKKKEIIYWKNHFPSRKTNRYDIKIGRETDLKKCAHCIKSYALVKKKEKRKKI